MNMDTDTDTTWYKTWQVLKNWEMSTWNIKFFLNISKIKESFFFPNRNANVCLAFPTQSHVEHGHNGNFGMFKLLRLQSTTYYTKSKTYISNNH